MTRILKTDAGLLARLRAAAGRTVSPAELHQQRVSFIYGNLPGDSAITRDQVEVAVRAIDKAR